MRAMFYACLAILVMFALLVASVVVSAVDLERYNFGLFLVLLLIVGIMITCAFCIANPHLCRNPDWYTRLCVIIQERYPDTQMPISSREPTSAHKKSTDGASKVVNIRQESRPTVTMLAPAVAIMHQVWRGMAWVAADIESTDDDAALGPTSLVDAAASSTDDAGTSSSADRRLSPIPESPVSPRSLPRPHSLLFADDLV